MSEIILKNGDEEVVFSKDDKGKFRQMPIDQILEKTLITGENVNNSVLGVLIQESMDELKNDIKRSIRVVMLQAIGFQKDSFGGHFTVDHCNGRMSAISDYLSQYTKDFVKKEIENYIKENESNIKGILHKGLAKEIEQELHRNTYGTVKHHLQQMAQEVISSEIDNLSEEKLMIKDVVQRSVDKCLLSPVTPKEQVAAKEVARRAKRRR